MIVLSVAAGLLLWFFTTKLGRWFVARFIFGVILNSPYFWIVAIFALKEWIR